MKLLIPFTFAIIIALGMFYKNSNSNDFTNACIAYFTLFSTLPLASMTFNKLTKDKRLNLFIKYFDEKHNFYSATTMQTVINSIEDMQEKEHKTKIKNELETKLQKHIKEQKC